MGSSFPWAIPQRDREPTCGNVAILAGTLVLVVFRRLNIYRNASLSCQSLSWVFANLTTELACFNHKNTNWTLQLWCLKRTINSYKFYTQSRQTFQSLGLKKNLTPHFWNLLTLKSAQRHFSGFSLDSSFLITHHSTLWLQSQHHIWGMGLPKNMLSAP